MAVVDIVINGERKIREVDPSITLLKFLRNELGLTGAKDACERGECGACTVLIGGRPAMSCAIFAASVKEPVDTIEGLADEADGLRQAFADTGAFQCAFCTPGMIVRSVALLRDQLPTSDDELRRKLSGNICRCTGYQSIVEAIRKVGAVSQKSETVNT